MSGKKPMGLAQIREPGTTVDKSTGEKICDGKLPKKYRKDKAMIEKLKEIERNK